MCGIVGYIGPKDVVPVLISGLKKLEYRGYDSAGIAYLDDSGQLIVKKEKGKLKELEKITADLSAKDTAGIGHTRWATHGEPNYVNSHPHINSTGDLAVVHNGIIENYLQIKEWLLRKGVVFRSQTDTEVIAHLINYHLDSDLKEAVAKASQMLDGSYAIAVVCARFPGEIVALRKDSPLVIGLGDGENLLASDIPALLEYTKDVYFLEDRELAVVTADKVELYDAYLNRIINKKPYHIDWDIKRAEKGGYEHFMMKEIEEQPRALADTLNPRVKDGEIDFSDINLSDQTLKDIGRILIIACGTAYHASFVGKYIIERFCRVPVEVEIASEFRYKDPVILPGTFVIVVSQSGETADTVAAMREAKRKGAYVLAICNVIGSTITREADAVLYTRAGPEIAVASTKAYTTQLMTLYMLCLKLAYAKGTLSRDEYKGYVGNLSEVPENVKKVLGQRDELQKYASAHFMEKSVFFIGRGLDYAVAMEGSLKLKEISYIHSEAYAAGELKHGTIALIEPGTLTVAILTQDELFEKSVSNVLEVTTRGGLALAVVQQKNIDKTDAFADAVVTIPDTPDWMAPITAIVPLQIFAYYMSVAKGCDVDKPRNLAKSVTVE